MVINGKGSACGVSREGESFISIYEALTKNCEPRVSPGGECDDIKSSMASNERISSGSIVIGDDSRVLATEDILNISLPNREQD